jgi:hypothetical protein
VPGRMVETSDLGRRLAVYRFSIKEVPQILKPAFLIGLAVAGIDTARGWLMHERLAEIVVHAALAATYMLAVARLVRSVARVRHPGHATT